MKALLFNLENNLKLKQILQLMNIEIKNISNSDHNKQLGYLLNKEYIKKQTEQELYFNEEMLILDEFSDEQLDTLLKLLKTNSISIPFKAIVTDTNINWTCIEVRNNLIEEYLAIKNSQKM